MATELPHLQDGTLSVRMLTANDIAAALDYQLRNREAHAPYSPRRPDSCYCAEFWQMRVETDRQQFEQMRSCMLHVFDDASGQIIGNIGFSNLVGYPFHAANLGYALDGARWGRGEMRRALQLALGFAFEHFNLHRIMANHLPDNLRSAGLLRRLGFFPEGYARDYLLIDGVWRDHVLTALTRCDWQARDHSAELVVGGNGQVR